MKLKLLSLQACRGVAAVLVVLYHAGGTIFNNPKFWNVAVFGNFFKFGHSGVYFFFVLSGFIILNAHRQDIGLPERAQNYFIRRIIRVYPTYWVVLLPISAIYLWKPSISSPELTAHSIVFNSPLLIGVNNLASLAVAWTLFHEVLFYILFGVLILNKRIGLILIAAWLGVCVILPFVYPALPSYHWRFVNVLFGFGMFVCFMLEKRRLPFAGPLAIGAGAAFFLACVGEYMGRINGDNPEILAYGLSSALLIAALVSLERQRPLTIPAPLLLVGEASYSIYLTHYPALSIVARIWIKVFGAERFPHEITYIGLVLTCVLIGCVFHILVEKPLITFLQNWQRGRAGAQRSPAVASPSA